MKIHEYQAEETLNKFNVPVQDGVAIKSMDEFDSAIFQLQQRGINQFVVKSQIHAGGRGKGKLYNPKKRDELILEGGKLSSQLQSRRQKKLLGKF